MEFLERICFMIWNGIQVTFDDLVLSFADFHWFGMDLASMLMDFTKFFRIEANTWQIVDEAIWNQS